MRNIIIAAVAASVVGLGAAQAADLGPSLKEAPAPVYIPTWGGFYVGASFGFGVGQVNNEAVGDHWIGVDHDHLIHDWHGHLFGDRNLEGAIFAAHAGYNWQRANWVFGVEGTINGVNNNNNDSCGNIWLGGHNWDAHCNNDNDWYATAVGRLGYAVGPAMIYALGGAAFTDRNNEFTVDGVTFTRDNDDNNDVGWVAGLGLEYAFSPRFSVRVEYSHVEFDDNNNHFHAVWGGAPEPCHVFDFDRNTDLSFDVIRIGASIRLGDRERPVEVPMK